MPDCRSNKFRFSSDGEPLATEGQCTGTQPAESRRFDCADKIVWEQRRTRQNLLGAAATICLASGKIVVFRRHCRGELVFGGFGGFWWVWSNAGV